MMIRYLIVLCIMHLMYLQILASSIISLSSLEKAQVLLSQMNITEKLSMMHGQPGRYIGNIAGNARLNIPQLKMQDGPQGFRCEPLKTGPMGSTTAWPSALSIAASWDISLMYQWANAMGLEFKKKGANIALAPGIGIARVPNAGRNFEYLCGEDPILGATLVTNVIKGIQDNGVIANAKHWVNNEIETDRKQVSSNVNERVRFELYYVPFQAAIDAGVLSVMCAYNRINDIQACENQETISVHLKDTLGFKGWVMSDWLATQSTVNSIKAGLDQEMPYGIYYNEKNLEHSLKNGDIDIKQIDNSVMRILTSMYEIGLFDNNYEEGNPNANVTSDAHNQLARELASNSIVLLKNDKNALPLPYEDLGSCIAVFGDETTVSGGGSGHVTPPYVITPTQGIIQALIQSNVAINTEVIYNAGVDLNDASILAKKCKYSVVVVATSSSEGSDRSSLQLGNNQDELVYTIASVNSNTIVVINTPGAVLMPWVSQVSAILVSWLPGQEAGNALADVLFGMVNPSGKLPVTMPNKENEVGFTTEQYPGIGSPPEASYIEELLIGYRWYEANNVMPLFSFGYGLSYTTFAYHSLQLTYKSNHNDHNDNNIQTKEQIHSKIASFAMKITNTGLVVGADVPQLYLSFPTAADEPKKQLKSFTKILLQPNETKNVNFILTSRDFSIWDSDIHDWKIIQGDYIISIGKSVNDIILTTSISM